MEQLLPTIYAIAVVLPLLSFVLILCCAKWLGRYAGWLATSAILSAALLSFLGFGLWLKHHYPESSHHAAAHEEHEGGEHPVGEHQEKHEGSKAKEEKAARAADELPLTFVALLQEPAEKSKTDGTPKSATAPEVAEKHEATEHATQPVYTGEYYTIGTFGPLRVTISYYIDSLTVCMFCMVTFIATCIHFYAVGYMHDELSDVTDQEVTLASGEVLHRPGRFPRFFQYMSLFCFSMLGLVLAGNIAMVFVFWELVGICSYFLIGFYIERKSASNAANKAFIVNRIGDFGMIIGLMIIWSTLGTFAFGDIDINQDGRIAAVEDSSWERMTMQPGDTAALQPIEQGIFSQVRPGPQHALIVPSAMVLADAAGDVAAIVRDHPGSLDSAQSQATSQLEGWRSKENDYGRWLLILAGLGIFCGCVGKSAQFPLHVWLPDAMEGPTPVSALVHSATMVAAGVYLVGRFFPFFAPEVLLVIAITGTITMLLGASIAFAANDIKRVLAYSTVSQLGLMMLALGVGGWLAGMMHLITHAFFKSLLFMCSGSVIHAVHTNDLRKMGGLIHKMPVTAITMLIGCLAIAGVSVPFVIGFSGYYSKDAILEQALSFWRVNGGGTNPWAGLFFLLAVFGAALTTCYMFRMWFMTFVGQPRDHHAYDHAHESPPVMSLPLVVLAVLAISVAWKIQLIGYFAIAAGFFIVRGVQQGWFKRLKASHGHDDHGHGSHDEHGHGHDDHSHAAHGHDDHHGHEEHHAEPTTPPLTWGWVGTMLAATLIGGALVQIGFHHHASAEFNNRLDGLALSALLEQARPLGTLSNATGSWTHWTWPNEHASHAPEIATLATLMATASWSGGILLAAAFFWWGVLNPDDVRRQFAPLYNLLVNKWWFDELYDFLFVQPVLFVSAVMAAIDKRLIDGFLDGLAAWVVWFSQWWEYVADQSIVDGFVNLFASWTYSLGISLHAIQTGRIRQYVMFIVIGAIAIFVLISFFWSPTLAR